MGAVEGDEVHGSHPRETLAGAVPRVVADRVERLPGYGEDLDLAQAPDLLPLLQALALLDGHEVVAGLAYQELPAVAPGHCFFIRKELLGREEE